MNLKSSGIRFVNIFILFIDTKSQVISKPVKVFLKLKCRFANKS